MLSQPQFDVYQNFLVDLVAVNFRATSHSKSHRFLEVELGGPFPSCRGVGRLQPHLCGDHLETSWCLSS